MKIKLNNDHFIDVFAINDCENEPTISLVVLLPCNTDNKNLESTLVNHNLSFLGEDLHSGWGKYYEDEHKRGKIIKFSGTSYTEALSNAYIFSIQNYIKYRTNTKKSDEKFEDTANMYFLFEKFINGLQDVL